MNEVYATFVHMQAKLDHLYIYRMNQMTLPSGYMIRTKSPYSLRQGSGVEDFRKSEYLQLAMEKHVFSLKLKY